LMGQDNATANRQGFVASMRRTTNPVLMLNWLEGAGLKIMKV
jgi:hypothetical protein